MVQYNKRNLKERGKVSVPNVEPNVGPVVLTSYKRQAKNDGERIHIVC
jgi:hypothetical protein